LLELLQQRFGARAAFARSVSRYRGRRPWTLFVQDLKGSRPKVAFLAASGRTRHAQDPAAPVSRYSTAEPGRPSYVSVRFLGVTVLRNCFQPAISACDISPTGGQLRDLTWQGPTKIAPYLCLVGVGWCRESSGRPRARRSATIDEDQGFRWAPMVILQLAAYNRGVPAWPPEQHAMCASSQFI
jgi:hypothetical protein